MLTPEEEVRKAKLLQELKELEDGARERALKRKPAYTFAKVTNPKSLAMIQHFQQIFGRHIPCLLESEHHTINLHQKLMDGIFGNPIQTINKSTFEADLRRFRAAIKVLAQWPVWGAMVGTGAQPPLEKDQDKGNVLQAALEIYDCLLTITDMADDKKLPQVLDQLEGWAREASEHL